MRWSVCLLCLAACNQAFDLVPTGGPDSDSDGIDDYSDNCPLVANQDQANGDGDALGDVCDPCVAGPQLGVDGDNDGVDDACDACLDGANSDEDADGILDGCDDCPADEDPAQVDGDGDGVGDACDIAQAVQNTRLLFDGFAPPRPAWDTGFWDWHVVDGSFGPVTPIMSKYNGAWNPDISVAGQRWYLDTAVTLFPDSAFEGAQITLAGLTSAGGFTGRECGLAFQQGQWKEPFTKAVVAVEATVRLRLVDIDTRGECWINGTLVRVMQSPDTTETWRPFLQTTTHTEYRWLDIVK